MSESANKPLKPDFALTISFTRDSLKFISKNSPLLNEDRLVELCRKAVNQLNGIPSNIDLKKLRNNPRFKKCYRIRYGDIRIIFSYSKGEIHLISIIKIDFRGDVYKL